MEPEWTDDSRYEPVVCSRARIKIYIYMYVYMMHYARQHMLSAVVDFEIKCALQKTFFHFSVFCCLSYVYYGLETFNWKYRTNNRSHPFTIIIIIHWVHLPLVWAD